VYNGLLFSKISNLIDLNFDRNLLPYSLEALTSQNNNPGRKKNFSFLRKTGGLKREKAEALIY
jgi:hypothetical protein